MIADATHIKQALFPIFDREPVLVAYLFGSQATGRAGPLSDIDIAVLLSMERESYTGYRIELFGPISDALRTDDIDIVVLNEAPPFLRNQVFRYGQVIYCRDESARIAFQVRASREYLDFQPYLERYQRALFQRIREGSFGH